MSPNASLNTVSALTFQLENENQLVKKMKIFKNLRKKDPIITKIMENTHTSEYADKFIILNGISIKQAGKLQKTIFPGEIAKEDCDGVIQSNAESALQKSEAEPS